MQRKYILVLLKEIGVFRSKLVDTTTDPSIKLGVEKVETFFDLGRYRKLV